MVRAFDIQRFGVPILLALVVGGAPVPIGAEQDKSSVELVVRGCLKGRDLSALDISGAEGLSNLAGAVFRLSAKGDVSKQIRQQNGRLVAVTGLVKRTAVTEPGIKVGGGRVVIGAGPMSTDPTRNPSRNSSPRVVPMQVSSVMLVEESCSPIKG